MKNLIKFSIISLFTTSIVLFLVVFINQKSNQVLIEKEFASPVPEESEPLLPEEFYMPGTTEGAGTYFDWENYKIDIMSWLTYKNEKHHYQIKYPKEATITSVPKAFHLPSEDLFLSDKINIELPSSEVSGTIVGENLVIDAIENPKKLSGEEWVEEIMAESQKEYDAGGAPYAWGPAEKESILINNISAYRIVTFGFDGYYERVYMPKGEFMYELGDYPIAEENPNFAYPIKLYKVYTAMISTFEFVE